MSTNDVLLVSRQAQVCELTLNRPSAGNALNQALHDALFTALGRAASDNTVHAVVLGAAGETVFSAGADLKEFSELPGGEMAMRRRALLMRTLLAMLDFPKPLICMVAARAIGAGAMLGLVADQTVAADSARFSFPEISLGMPSPVGAELILARSGRSAVQRMIQNGEVIAADEALRLGLVDAVVSREALAEQVHLRASAAKSGRVYAGNKQWINRHLRHELEQAALAAARLSQGLAPIENLHAT